MRALRRDTLGLWLGLALLGACSGLTGRPDPEPTWPVLGTEELEELEAEREAFALEMLVLDMTEDAIQPFEVPPGELPGLELEVAIDRLTNQIGKMSEDLLNHQAALSLAESFPQEFHAVEIEIPEAITRGIVIMGAAATFVGAGVLIMLAVLLSRVRKIPTWQVQQVSGPTS